MDGHSALRTLAAFGRARGGNVAIIFAAVMIPVSGIVSAAIDFGRAAKVRSTMQTAVGAAAAAASARLDEGRDAIEAEVRNMLSANLPSHLSALPHRVSVPTDLSSVEVAMEATVPTTLMAILGVQELAVEATGFAKRPPAPPAAPAATPPADADAPDAEAIGRLLGAAAAPGQGPAFSPGLGSLPAAPAAGSAELERAARQVAEQLQALQGQLGAGAGSALPPAAAAEIERALRDLGRR